MVTGMHFYPNPSSLETQSLLLTSSTDWSVKLWRTEPSKIGSHSKVQYLKSFDGFDDYVSDVAWSPTHPAVFATGDACGNMDLFNINQSDVAISRISTPNAIGINKVDWNNNGDLIATGCLDGTIQVYDVSNVIVNVT
jgi:dynein intermediate chain